MAHKDAQGWFARTSADQAKDTGQAMVLLCLLLWAFSHGEKLAVLAPWRGRLIVLAMVLLLINMTVPRVFKLIAPLWYGLAHVLGAVVSRVILTVLFFVLVTPVGLFRRLIGADAMQLKKWKAGNESVFRERNHQYTAGDIEHPY